MSKYGDVYVVEVTTAGDHTYKLELDRPWDKFASDLMEKNAVLVFGVFVNRPYIRRVVLVENSIDVPSAEVSQFPRLCEPDHNS